MKLGDCICKKYTLKAWNASMVNHDISERYCYKPSLRWNPMVEDYMVRAYGVGQFSRISNSLTNPPSYSCIRVNTLKSTSDAVIGKLLFIIQKTGLLNEVEACNLNYRGAIFNSDIDQNEVNSCKECSIHQTWGQSSSAVKATSEYCLTGPIFKCLIPGLEDYVIFVRGSGPHRIEYGYKHDRSPKEVIVSRKCAEAVLRGAQVYVPGILACSAHVEKGDIVAVSVAVEQPTVDGGWGVDITRGTILQGSRTDPHHFKRNGLYIGRGVTMMSRAEIFRVSKGIAVDMSQRVYNLPSFYDVLDGEIFLQNLPSIITAHVLDPQPGERVLDMCAAPGGKTTAIAILMKDEGEVIAIDRSHNKVLGIQKLAVQLGLNCITALKLDALRAVCLSKESRDGSCEPCRKDSTHGTNRNSGSFRLHVSETISLDGCSEDQTCKKTEENNGYDTCNGVLPKNIGSQRNGPGRNQCMGGRAEVSRGFSPNTFDHVLLDAPCSALGLRPRLFAGEVTIEALRKHAKYQKKLFDQAVQLVRTGGVLLYSTCTINPGENEAVVRYGLDTYKFLSLAAQKPRIGGPGLVGSCCFDDGFVEEWLRPGEEELVQRFDPSSSLDTIGFFIAKFNVGCKDVSSST